MGPKHRVSVSLQSRAWLLGDEQGTKPAAAHPGMKSQAELALLAKLKWKPVKSRRVEAGSLRTLPIASAVHI